MIIHLQEKKLTEDSFQPEVSRATARFPSLEKCGMVVMTFVIKHCQVQGML